MEKPSLEEKTEAAIDESAYDSCKLGRQLRVMKLLKERHQKICEDQKEF